MSNATVTVELGNIDIGSGGVITPEPKRETTTPTPTPSIPSGSSESSSSASYAPFYYGVNSTAFKTFWVDIQACCASSEVSFPVPSLESIRQSIIKFLSKAGSSSGLGSTGAQKSFTQALSQIYQAIQSKMAFMNLDSLVPFTVLPFASIEIDGTDLSLGAGTPSVFSFLGEQI